MAHNGRMQHKRALGARQLALPTPSPSTPANVVSSVPVPVPVVATTPVPVVPPAVTTSTTTPLLVATTTPVAVVPTTTTSTTPTTYPTTPPATQTMVTTTPSGIASFAKATSAAPPLVPSYVAPVSASVAHPSGASANVTGTAAGAHATSTTTAAGSMSTATIIGVAAGGLAGVIVIGAIIAFIIRKCRKPKIPEEFNRRSFIRASVQLPADSEKPARGTAAALALARSNTAVTTTPSLPGAGVRGGPRPPTMLQNHYQAPAAQMSSLQPGQYINGNAYGNPRPMAPPASYYAPGSERFAYGQGKSLPVSPMDATAPQGNAYYRPPQQQYQQVQQPQQAYRQNQDVTANLARKPTYASAKSGDTTAVDHSFSSTSEDQVGRKLTSVTPFQAQQYAEISRLVNQPTAAPVPEQLGRSRSQEAEISRNASPAPAPTPTPSRALSPGPAARVYARPMDNNSGFRSPTPPSPLPPPRNLVSPFQRIDSMPPVLPPLASHTSTSSFTAHLQNADAFRSSSERSLNSLNSRTGTPVDPNPQQAYYATVRTTSPEQLPVIRTEGAAPENFATLNSPHSQPRTPRYHSGVSAVSHAGSFGTGYAAVPASTSGMNLAVPTTGPRPLSVANSDRYSMIDVEDVYGGI